MDKHKSGKKRQKSISQLFEKPAKTAKTSEDNTNASASVSSSGISSLDNVTDPSARVLSFSSTSEYQCKLDKDF